MIDTPIPKHESIVEFEIQKVKQAIAEFAEIHEGTDFRLKDRNDIFGSYVFTIFKNNSWNGFSTGNLNITLNEIENKKTKIIVETLNTGKNHYVNIRDLSQAQSDFLLSLAKILSGDYSKDSVRIEQGKGCLGIIIFVVSLSVSIAYFI